MNTKNESKGGGWLFKMTMIGALALCVVLLIMNHKQSTVTNTETNTVSTITVHGPKVSPQISEQAVANQDSNNAVVKTITFRIQPQLGLSHSKKQQ